MLSFAQKFHVGRTSIIPPDEAAVLLRMEERLPPVLSVIAGMVDLTGFFNLGHIFTAHVTGNIVVVAAAAVHAGAFNLMQAMAIPVFMLALAAAWLVARVSSLRGASLTRLLLLIQFLLLSVVFAFSVTTEPSVNPDGLTARIAVMVAVCAMAFQYALLRLAMPNAVSTAVMTGNLTNTVLSLMDILSPQHPLMTVDRGRLKRSLHLLIGFLVGCLVAAAAISTLGDWAWSIPTVLAALAIAVR
ncbi:YoaK family protein [Bradyrhizobium iriomotense]|uniref:DUF1275 family protein n=1 Tax=Bradyrhizobium iriomotense TaxID=441950 RepID=A0ABQ6APW5_9BRAD|nr:YoaK family protein [Bradyrhizobium iriomotense]GLR84279.1 DUF1275 family protein [Bradyrhizobium iriomotense]